MKKYVFPIYLFIMFFTNQAINAQNGHIEIGISYDDSFEAKAIENGYTNAKALIDYMLFDVVLTVLNSNPDLQNEVSFERYTKKANLGGWAGNDADMLKKVSSVWVSDKFCEFPDIFVHCTGDIMPGGGTASLQSCFDVYDAGKPGGAIAEFYLGLAGIRNFTHELGHCLFGAGEYSGSPSDQNYIMNPDGPNSLNYLDWRVSDENANLLLAKLADQNHCYNNNNIDLVDDCFNCDNKIASVPGGTIKHDDVISAACGNPSELIIESSIYNSCNFEEREMDVILQYRDDEIEVLEITEGFAGPFPISANDARAPNTVYTLNRTLTADEIFSCQAKIKVIGGAKRGSDYNAPFQFNYNFNPASSAGYTGQYNIFYPRVHLDLSNLGDIFSGYINQAYINEVGEQLICPNSFPLDVTIDGHLHFNSYTTYCNTDFYMSPNSSITIDDRVTFNNCNFLTCEGSQWQGIKIKDSAEVTMNDCTVRDATKGILADVYNSELTFNNSEIVNCETGLEIYNSNDFGQYFGWANITGSDFIENSLYGIHVRDINFQNVLKSTFSGNRTGLYAKNTSISVNQCTFENNNSYAINQDANGKYCSVLRTNFLNNDFFDINANKSNVYVADQCQFVGSKVGIRIYNGIATAHNIVNSSFTDIPFCVYSTNNTPIAISELTGCTFENYAYGFRSNDIATVSNNGWNIKDNTFTASDARSAIRTTGGHNYDISENTIIHTTARAGSASDLVALEGNLQSKVSCNILRGPLESRENDNARGIFLSGGNRNSLDCNTISGSSFNINVSGMSYDAEIKGNTLSNSASGLLYGIWPSIGGAYTGEQEHHGNIFDNASFSSQFGARHLDTDPIEVEKSRYTIDAGANSNYSTEVDAVGDWFVNSPSASTFECNPMTCPAGIGSNLVSIGTSAGLLSKDIMNSKLGNSAFSNSLISSGQFYLYQDLITELIADNEVDQMTSNFISELENSEQGKFIHSLDNLSESLQRFATLENQASEIWKQIRALETDNLNSPNNTQSIKDLNQKIMRYDEQYNQHYVQHLDLMSSLNQSLNSSEINEITLSNRSEVIIAQMAKQMELPIDEAAINRIANQCPIQGGDAVYIARGLMEEIYGIINYDDNKLCEEVNQKSMKDNDQMVSFSVSPNPASEKIIVTSKLSIRKVQIVDLSGKTMILKDENDTSLEIDISTLNSGIYFVHLTFEDNTTQAQKIIKID